MKPLLKLTERVKDYEGLASGYGALQHDYQKLAIQIHQTRDYSPSHKSQFQILLDRGDDLRAKEVVDRVPKKRLLVECRAAVDAELPEDNFFVPV